MTDHTGLQRSKRNMRKYKEYYESQGIEENPNYVDPGTNKDENYIASYVEENPDKFYGDDVEVVTVEELPDEEALKEELFAIC